ADRAVGRGTARARRPEDRGRDHRGFAARHDDARDRRFIDVDGEPDPRASARDAARAVAPSLRVRRAGGVFPAESSMKRKILISVAALVAIIALLAGIKTLQIMAMIKTGAAFTQPAETVTATEVKQETWESLLHAVGSVTAVHGVVLKAELAGTVREIAFDSGAYAQKGQVLVKLDTSMEEAQLKSAEAEAELARLNFDRAKDLKKQGVISQSDYDASEAAFRSKGSQADTIRATIGKKTIKAPFSGQLGIRSVNLGQYVDAGNEIV